MEPLLSLKSQKIAWSLVFLAFLSKVSLAFLPFVPRQSGFFLFQNGLHPYLNVFLNFAIGFLLLRQPDVRAMVPSLDRYHKAFTRFAFGTVLVLALQTFLQTLFGQDASFLLVLATLLSSFFLIFLFGLVLPQVIPAEDFVNGVARICLWITVLSVLALLVGFPTAFKGNRFVGILKHIPFMVTVCSIGYIFNLNRYASARGFLDKAILVVSQLIFFYGIWLTGTRSALSAALLGTVLFFLLYQSRHDGFRIARILIVWILLLSSALFGTMAYDFGKAVMTGEKSIGNREAQDGIGDRVDEVYRGLDLLEAHPHIGLGLLSKFSSADGDDVVEHYNSFQDPHNLFISSAVLAGWPFALLVMYGFLYLIMGSFLAVFRGTTPLLTIGVYLVSHLPVLFIYHMHLSLGGLADRLYWLCFGYLSLKSFHSESEKNI